MSKEWKSTVTSVFLLVSLVIAAALLFKPASAQASKSERSAKELEESDETELVLAKWEAIPFGHPHHKVAVEELLKLYYRLQNWPAFFSYAQFYRKAYSFSERSRVQLLELLALLRHCRNDLLEPIIRTYRKNLPAENQMTLDQIEALSKTSFKGKSAKRNKLDRTGSYWEGTTYWKSSPEVIGKISPKQIKIDVENLCRD